MGVLRAKIRVLFDKRCIGGMAFQIMEKKGKFVQLLGQMTALPYFTSTNIYPVMRTCLFFIVSFFCSTFLVAQKNSFSEIHKKVAIDTKTHPEWLSQLAEIGISTRCGVSFANDGKMLFQLSESELQLLEIANIPYTVLIEDLTPLYRESESTLTLARQQLEADKNRPTNRNFNMGNVVDGSYTQSEECLEEDIVTPTNFHLTSTNYMNGNLTYTEMLAELDEMRQFSLNNGLNIVSMKTPLSPTRTTYENRPIYYVRISDNADVDEDNEPETLLTAMHHAREPVGMMNTIFTMWYIIENYGSDPFITNLVNHHEIYFVPCVNPDGFQYNVNNRAGGGAGFWRKNRQNNGGNCIGTDPNRNYCYNWHLASSNCNSSTYRGPNCLSEQENLSMQDFVSTHEIKAAFNCHTAIPCLFYPYADGGTPPDNVDQFIRWTHDMTRYNRFLYGDGLLEGSFGAIGGESDDWMFENYNILAFTPELSRSSIFWPPSTAILPDSKEFLRANLTLMAYSGVYAHLHDLTPLGLTAQTGTLQFGLERLGATNGNFSLTVTPVSGNIQSVNNSNHTFINPSMLDINNNRVNVNYTLIPDILPGAAVIFQVTLNNGSYDIFSKTITKVYQPTVLSSDSFDDVALFSNWVNDGWQNIIDANESFAGSGAVATGAYSGSVTRTLEWNSFIDLSGWYQAELSFYAHWDVEKLWDYFVVEASDNGDNWTPLCGNYSKPGSPSNIGNGLNSTQPTGVPLTDGKQNDWVLLKYNLSDFTAVDANPVTFRLRLTTNGSNDGTTNNGNGTGVWIDEFRVVGTASAPLAVEALDFSAVLKNDNLVALEWLASSNLTTLFFEIERSTDGNNWQSIGKVYTGEKAIYIFEDNTPFLGKNYYRLSWKNEANEKIYSAIKTIEIQGISPINIRPINHQILMLSSNETISFKYSIFNAMGQVVVQKKLEDFNGEMRLNMEDWSSGIYFFVIYGEGLREQPFKFFKI